ncbi:flagellar basal body rod modification protein [Roseovarius spongiae]|uniref:Basal-body rod modification protein FlgD n=1 Tax=Roseovarius spongiae TaxID=2320272 RepID=A0A3A8B7X2_9RHOB|nr:flagellar hook capping FlgD N-terminal domain-containing protein [Roseovarius spongiae]RKF13057.1 flagellar basal body rod modification protein [Roseovarius spongiae]
MEINTSQTPRPASEPRPQSPAAATDALSSDFETFLKMLTVQMENQDPLNPVDSSDFASQLAAFSAVEQQVRTNELLGGLSEQMGLMGFGQLQGWVGMVARAEMPIAFDGAPVALRYTTEADSDLAQLVVRNEAGAIVHQQAVPPGGGDMTWNGRDDTGAALPDGTYSLSVDSFRGESLLGSTPVKSQAKIVEARLAGGSTILVMEGGHEMPAASVDALLRADAA